ncbi:hypothetical protein DFH09DRAFT_1437018 [Mycena vulgaris]|nr:hypothetical protein DFH09DRAFT_1437018 [Mycena vulgaris]
MAELPAEGEHGDSEFSELDSEEPVVTSPINFQNMFLVDDMAMVEPPPIPRPASPSRQALYQPLLPGAAPPLFGRSKPADRCAICVKSYCRKRHECPGRGGRKNCRCSHPPLRDSKKAATGHADGCSNPQGVVATERAHGDVVGVANRRARAGVTDVRRSSTNSDLSCSLDSEMGMRHRGKGSVLVGCSSARAHTPMIMSRLRGRSALRRAGKAASMSEAACTCLRTAPEWWARVGEAVCTRMWCVPRSKHSARWEPYVRAGGASTARAHTASYWEWCGREGVEEGAHMLQLFHDALSLDC